MVGVQKANYAVIEFIAVINILVPPRISAFKFVMTPSFQRNNSKRICFKIGVNK